ncbi:DUF1707 and DUF4190 domain-containing protein [Streptomyces sp. CA-111067]|uniref:DUF1707 and DUF4190 domain-containing protein n=1 Tax=Streptomyces sp. CA-111067 TaxID=3240046 RepID=UPI003D97F39F
MLAGDADRERAVNVLKDAFTEGRLTQGEYEDRMGRAYQARTYGELDVLTGDIPHAPVPRTFQPAPPPVPFPMQPPFPQPFQPPFRPPTNNGNAIASLVCGILGTMTFGVTSIPAVILGHVAKSQIRRSGEQGEGMATGGLVLGYLTLAGVIGFIVLIVGVASSGG